MSVSQSQRWFQCFGCGNYSVEDEPRSGSPQEFDNEKLRALIDQNPALTIEDLSKQLQATHSTIHRHLKSIGNVSKLRQCVPHELWDMNLNQRMEICSSHLCRLGKDSFLNRIITGDEKWILCKNIKRKRQWIDKDKTPSATSKPGLHPKKIMLRVWWDMEAIIHYELLRENQTVTKELYCEELSRLKQAIHKKKSALA